MDTLELNGRRYEVEFEYDYDTQSPWKECDGHGPVREIFRAQMLEVRAFWGDFRGLNDSSLDMARIQWKRARYDAHDTLRGAR